MILGYIKAKLEVVNLIHSGLHSDGNYAFNNEFLLFTAHIYYRSVVIDLCALFLGGRNDKNSFHLLYIDNRILRNIDAKSVEKIKALLDDHELGIGKLKVLRDKEYAHYDFQKKSISFNFDELLGVNNLFTTANEILQICAENSGLEYDFTLNSLSNSLEQLLKMQPKPLAPNEIFHKMRDEFYNGNCPS